MVPYKRLAGRFVLFTGISLVPYITSMISGIDGIFLFVFYLSFLGLLLVNPFLFYVIGDTSTLNYILALPYVFLISGLAVYLTNQSSLRRAVSVFLGSLVVGAIAVHIGLNLFGFRQITLS
jgi:hypothetical protein